MCGHKTFVVYLCVSECVYADMLSTGWQLVLSQSAGGSTIFRKPYARKSCAYSLQCYTITSNCHTSLNTALVTLSE